jgi:hypothetical protein
MSDDGHDSSKYEEGFAAGVELGRRLAEFRDYLAPGPYDEQADDWEPVGVRDALWTLLGLVAAGSWPDRFAAIGKALGRFDDAEARWVFGREEQRDGG